MKDDLILSIIEHITKYTKFKSYQYICVLFNFLLALSIQEIRLIHNKIIFKSFENYTLGQCIDWLCGIGGFEK